MPKPSDVIEELDETTRSGGDVSADELVDTLGRRSIGAMIAIPAALELTPVGGVPGVPTALACLVAVLAAQILIGRDRFWLPGLLARRTVAADTLHEAVEKMRPAADWADRNLGQHLPVLIDNPAPRIAALAILVLCTTVPVLELVPFASSIPMVTIMLFGLALVTRDGRVMALAWVCFAAAACGIWSLWP